MTYNQCYNRYMIETLFFIGGVLTGVIAVHTGYFAGTKIVQKTYVELTQLPDEIQNTIDREQQQSPRDDDGYDWDSYEAHITRIEDGSDDVPES